jgi:hypothetical protein
MYGETWSLFSFFGSLVSMSVSAWNPWADSGLGVNLLAAEQSSGQGSFFIFILEKGDSQDQT